MKRMPKPLFRNRVMFVMPKTARCRVLYKKNGVLYQTGIMPTPGDNDHLEMYMLSRQCGLKHVVRVEGVR